MQNFKGKRIVKYVSEYIYIRHPEVVDFTMKKNILRTKK